MKNPDLLELAALLAPKKTDRDRLLLIEIVKMVMVEAEVPQKVGIGILKFDVLKEFTIGLNSLTTEKVEKILSKAQQLLSEWS